MRMLLLLAMAASLGAAEVELEVVRKKSLWMDETGMLSITDQKICFSVKEEARCWDLREDVQSLDRVSPTELVLVSYEDAAWRLGLDRRYRFEVTGGEVSDALFARMAEGVGKPVVDRVTAEPKAAEWRLAAKRLKRFGGPDGTLFVTAERVAFLTDAEEESREWRLGEEVASVWSGDPYRLELHVYEDAGRPVVYRFALKERLDAEVYRRLKLRLYGM